MAPSVSGESEHFNITLVVVHATLGSFTIADDVYHSYGELGEKISIKLVSIESIWPIYHINSIKLMVPLIDAYFFRFEPEWMYLFKLRALI